MNFESPVLTRETAPPALPFDLAGRRVFIAGHRGMVGAAVVRRLAEEACEVLTGLLSPQETTTFKGRYYQLTDARCNPKPVQPHLPICVGGSGEKRTLRTTARFAQHWNFVAPGFEVLALAAFSALWARSTGRDPWLWLAAGLVFNLFALLAMWVKHEGDKEVAQVAESGGPFELPREGTAPSQNVRPA